MSGMVPIEETLANNSVGGGAVRSMQAISMVVSPENSMSNAVEGVLPMTPAFKQKSSFHRAKSPKTHDSPNKQSSFSVNSQTQLHYNHHTKFSQQQQQQQQTQQQQEQFLTQIPLLESKLPYSPTGGGVAAAAGVAAGQSAQSTSYKNQYWNIESHVFAKVISDEHDKMSNIVFLAAILFFGVWNSITSETTDVKAEIYLFVLLTSTVIAVIVQISKNKFLYLPATQIFCCFVLLAISLVNQWKRSKTCPLVDEPKTYFECGILHAAQMAASKHISPFHRAAISLISAIFFLVMFLIKGDDCSATPVGTTQVIVNCMFFIVLIIIAQESHMRILYAYLISIQTLKKYYSLSICSTDTNKSGLSNTVSIEVNSDDPKNCQWISGNKELGAFTNWASFFTDFEIYQQSLRINLFQSFQSLVVNNINNKVDENIYYSRTSGSQQKESAVSHKRSQIAQLAQAAQQSPGPNNANGGSRKLTDGAVNNSMGKPSKHSIAVAEYPNSQHSFQNQHFIYPRNPNSFPYAGGEDQVNVQVAQGIDSPMYNNVNQYGAVGKRDKGVSIDDQEFRQKRLRQLTMEQQQQSQLSGTNRQQQQYGQQQFNFGNSGVGAMYSAMSGGQQNSPIPNKSRQFIMELNTKMDYLVKKSKTSTSLAAAKKQVSNNNTKQANGIIKNRTMPLLKESSLTSNLTKNKQSQQQQQQQLNTSNPQDSAHSLQANSSKSLQQILQDSRIRFAQMSGRLKACTNTSKEKYFSLSLLKYMNLFREEVVVVSITDVTVLEEIRNLEREVQFKERMFANVAHDLRTPLYAVTHSTDKINEVFGIDSCTNIKEQRRQLAQNISKIGHAEAAELHDQLNTTVANVHLMKAIIQDIIDNNRSRMGKLEGVFHKFNVIETMEEMRKLTEILLWEKRKKIHFRFDIDPKLLGNPDIFSDATRLKQVLMNLISNSIKFTKQGGILVRVRRVSVATMSLSSLEKFLNPVQRQNRLGIFERTLIRFQLIDTGIGMTAKQLASLFTPYSTNNPDNLNSNGIGLGLTICKSIVEILGPFSLRVASKEKKGSKFTFYVFDDDRKNERFSIKPNSTYSQVQEVISPAPFGTGWLLPMKEDQQEGVQSRILKRDQQKTQLQHQNTEGQITWSNNYVFRYTDPHHAITYDGEGIEAAERQINSKDSDNRKSKAKSVASGGCCYGDHISPMDMNKVRKSFESLKVQRGSSRTTDPMSSFEKAAGAIVAASNHNGGVASNLAVPIPIPVDPTRLLTPGVVHDELADERFPFESDALPFIPVFENQHKLNDFQLPVDSNHIRNQNKGTDKHDTTSSFPEDNKPEMHPQEHTKKRGASFSNGQQGGLHMESKLNEWGYPIRGEDVVLLSDSEKGNNYLDFLNEGVVQVDEILLEKDDVFELSYDYGIAQDEDAEREDVDEEEDDEDGNSMVEDEDIDLGSCFSDNFDEFSDENAANQVITGKEISNNHLLRKEITPSNYVGSAVETAAVKTQMKLIKSKTHTSIKSVVSTQRNVYLKKKSENRENRENSQQSYEPSEKKPIMLSSADRQNHVTKHKIVDSIHLNQIKQSKYRQGNVDITDFDKEDSQKKAQSVNVLVCDDQNFSIEALKRLLQRVPSKKIEIDTCNNGEDAIDKFMIKNKPDSQEVYHYIFLDWNMPIMDGYETSSKIKFLVKDGHIDCPIIICSAYDDTSEINKCLRSGTDAILNKPVRQDQLNELLMKFELTHADVKRSSTAISQQQLSKNNVQVSCYSPA